MRTACDALRPERLTEDPRLALVSAMAHLEVGDLTAADENLARADAAWPANPPAELVSWRTLTRTRRALLERELFRAVAPEPAARELAGATLKRATQGGDDYLAARSLTLLAAATGLNGEFRDMTSLAERAARTAPAGAWRATEGEALTSVLRAYAALMQTQPEECLRLVTPAADFAATLGADAALLPMIDTLRAAARFDLGERSAGFEGLRAARLATRPDRARDEQIALVALPEHRAATQLGHTDAARAVLAWAEARLGTTGEVLLLRAAGQAGISRYGAARGHLRPLLDGSVPATVSWPVVDGWLLECWIALRRGVRARAREALRHALSAAEEIGVLRPLTMASPPVLELLAEQLGSLGELEPYARQVLDIRGSREARQPSTPLTERERAVLELLPALRSFEEIAADLTVSINTVKSHVKSIYGKLGVNSRRTAVAAAHRQGLIALDVRLRCGR